MKNKSKKWWFWVLAVLLFPLLCLYGIYRLVINYRTTGRKVWLVGVVPLALVSLFGFVVYAGAFSGRIRIIKLKQLYLAIPLVLLAVQYPQALSLRNL